MANNTVTLSTGNLTIPLTYGIAYYPATHPPVSSKVYYEVTLVWSEGHSCVGFGYGENTDHSHYTQLYPYGNSILIDGTTYNISELVSPATFGCCLNKESNEIIYYNNGKLIGRYTIPRDSSNYYAAVSNGSSFYYPCDAITVNFGATAFKYAIPDGFISYDGRQDKTVTKIFMKDKNGFHTLTIDNTWQLVSTNLPTKEQFLEQGMDHIPTLEMVKTLENPELYAYTNRGNTLNLQTSFTSKEKLLLPVHDLFLRDVHALQRVTTMATGNIKIIMSNDSGITWYGLSSQRITITDLSMIREKGLTVEQLTSITEAEWAAFLGEEKKLRFAYLLYPDSITTACQVDKLEMTIKRDRRWNKVTHMADYEYVHTKDHQLKIIIKENGDYKINYCK